MTSSQLDVESRFLGLAPFLKMSIAGIDLRPIAQAMLQTAGEQENNAVLWMNLATVLFAIEQRDIALAVQEQALADQTRYTLPASVQPAKYRLLVLMAPGDLAENTPLDCLVEGTGIELELYFCSPDAPLPPAIPEHDAVFVAISDTLQSQPLLQQLQPLLANWPRPVINRPASIGNVERQRASELLQGIPGLVMPTTATVSRNELVAAIQNQVPYPIILRPVGSHAGRNLAKIETDSALTTYLAQVDADHFYLSAFIDYAGPDGLYRKYRLVLINGQAYASHMAISEHWMIHYLNAGMYDSAQKRAEEEAFMANFAQFAARHQNALDSIQQRAGLEYLCIDCAETQDGQLLIFEIDHAMVVHALDSTELFPYKQVYMGQVKQAFEQFLATLCR